MTKWISCQKTLPPAGEYVLAYCAKRKEQMVVRWVEDIGWSLQFIGVLGTAVKITHWLKLPPSPPILIKGAK